MAIPIAAVAMIMMVSVRLARRGHGDGRAGQDLAAGLDRQHRSWSLVVAGLPGQVDPQAELTQLAHHRSYRLTEQCCSVDRDFARNRFAAAWPGRLRLWRRRSWRAGDRPASQAGDDGDRRRSQCGAPAGWTAPRPASERRPTTALLT